jgi:hypothetical protein
LIEPEDDGCGDAGGDAALGETGAKVLLNSRSRLQRMTRLQIVSRGP